MKENKKAFVWCGVVRKRATKAQFSGRQKMAIDDVRETKNSKESSTGEKCEKRN